MSSEEILKKVIDAILAGDISAVETAGKEAIDAGIIPEQNPGSSL